MIGSEEEERVPRCLDENVMLRLIAFLLSFVVDCSQEGAISALGQLLSDKLFA